MPNVQTTLRKLPKAVVSCSAVFGFLVVTCVNGFVILTTVIMRCTSARSIVVLNFVPSTKANAKESVILVRIVLGALSRLRNRSQNVDTSNLFHVERRRRRLSVR